MMRSYAVTMIFVVSRVLDAIPVLGRLDTGANPSMIWFCNVLAWVVPTLILQWPTILRRETTKCFQKAGFISSQMDSIRANRKSDVPLQISGNPTNHKELIPSVCAQTLND
jgi:hypothetical protein